MSTVQWSQIGTLNKQLVLDLIANNVRSSGYLIDDPKGWLHGSFEYDIREYALKSYTDKKQLPLGWYGTKYYCYNTGGIDMKKRIVVIFEKDGSALRKASTAKYFRLIHTEGKPGVYTNDYQSIDEITDIGT